ncbi:hypothetical protein TW78_00830 [Vibrio coralliilyticus]|uniref:Uncharacterized protein n=1 Tax=Vibrio coralliilyticus TaxID=190893 RepID=A0A837G301_9VIBR|nr:hypothetical protein [Vibrio coralliilyticus]KJY79279.1 hypothetical protein TW78_00830 [Vibrio coralliilyticus]QOU30805.1 hypothetical protein TW71_004645 [Vibrio coralliilyticus]
MTNIEFVNSANPHSWFLVADDLHSQAEFLMKSFGQGELIRRDFVNGTSDSWDNINRSVFLLASFALENTIKAFLVYENPDWISNGVISKKMRSHSLSKLVQMSNLIPYKDRGQSILTIFENGNESWARYQWLIGAYGKRLVKLLEKKWEGPHGFSGSYEISGCFFGVNFEKKS